jgi:hypothetical protein
MNPRAQAMAVLGAALVPSLCLANAIIPQITAYPAIVDLADPSRRHHIDTFSYSLDWTTDEGVR